MLSAKLKRARGSNPCLFSILNKFRYAVIAKCYLFIQTSESLPLHVQMVNKAFLL